MAAVHLLIVSSASIVGLLDRIRMGDLSVWVVSGAPEGSRLAAAMELHHQAQKEAMAPQQAQAPPLFLDFSHGGKQIKQSALLGSAADFVFLGSSTAPFCSDFGS